MTGRTRRTEVAPSPQYQPLSREAEARLSSEHYEEAEFFKTVLGGEWNVYSCVVWEGATTLSEAQERKLDLLAELMDLRPGQRILDVGCGWGGPLVYLCKTYGVEGVGLTPIASQKAIADQRIAHHGANARIVEGRWDEYDDDRGFDAVYTDEVIVHFHDLAGFFAKVHDLLRDGGRMVNKELHFRHADYGRRTTRGSSFVNQIFGSTGNYRTLAEELALVGSTGFALERVHQIAQANYHKTLDAWIANLAAHRPALEASFGRDFVRRYRIYLELTRRFLVGGEIFNLDVVVGRKLAPLVREGPRPEVEA